jgi:outer membrane beta-barrel protein
MALGTARAERRNPLDGQPSIRHKVEMRRLRFEISPQFVVSMNQDFRHFIGGGLVLHFHIADFIGIGAQLAGGGGINTGITDKLVGSGDIANPMNGGALGVNETGLQPSRQQFMDHINTINFLFSLYATLTPFAGKLAMFGALFLRYDFYVMGGIGGLNTTNTFDPNQPGYAGVQRDCADRLIATNPNNCDPMNAGFSFAGMFGVGTHLYFTPLIGLQLEVRDYIASGNPGGLDVNQDPQRKVNEDDRTIQNNLMFSLGLTFMLPPTPKVSP